MSDKRVREIQPGEPDQPSMMPDESCEDGDDFFLAIANRNKLKDDDINALPPTEEEAFLKAILAEEGSTNTINQDDVEEDDPADSAKEASSSIVEAVHEEEEAAGDDEEMPSQPPPSPEPEQPKPKSPPKSPRRSSPSVKSPVSQPKPSSPPQSRSAVSPPQPKPVDPVAAYAERRSREEMEKEKEETEKRELLTRFYEFEEAGVPCPKRFTLKSDLQEMRFEFKKLDDEFNRKKSIQMWKDGIKLVTNLVEVLNKKFDPIGWKATDFSDNLNLKLNEADWALRELHKKYFRRGGKPSPELALLFIVGTVALDTHKSNGKKEEQRQQKANAATAANFAHPHAGHPGYPYPPPYGYPGYPPMYWNPAMRQPGMPGTPQQPGQQHPGQHPQQQPGQQQPQQQPGAARPSVRLPEGQPQQQAPAQQRPGVVINPNGIPGTSPTHSTQSPQMPLVDPRPVAAAVPSPLPNPTPLPNPGQQQLGDQPKRRTLRPPADNGPDIGPIAGIMGGMAGMGGATPAAPPSRKTSNYGPNAVIDDEEEPEPKPTRKSPLPVEPPMDASPTGVRFDNLTGQLVFE